MKFAFIFLQTLMVISHQQFQRPRVVPWLSPYSSFIRNYNPLYYDNAEDVIPHFRYSRPLRPTIYSLQNEDFNRDVMAVDESHDMMANDSHEEFANTQPRINGFKGYHNNNAGRFFYASTINNPFLKTATFTISSTVTTVGSIVLCVPSNNLAAVPSPTCAGRKKREMDDSEHFQFPIVPSETVKLATTALPYLHTANETRKPMADGQVNSNDLVSSKNEKDEEDKNAREKRLFGGGLMAASTTVTRYLFVGTTLTSTVILDPTGQNVAVCLPAGYVVCA
ncbi:uncharacterized protein LOC130689731 [Daphnia carinata]|uniref:uncharacterized protein LOC130689731 n=1 Tax=Daphnia carinata TaxID=120202 RepID=UPI00257E0D12|nr:uncharacterized protein LOC130689731 [Daphnia carinata]